MQTKNFHRKFKVFICIALFSAIICPALAQPRTSYYIDSIKKVLPGLRNNERIDALNHLGRAHQMLNPDTSRWYSQQALAEAKKINYTKGMAFAHIYLARVESSSSRNISVQEQHFLTAITLLESIKDEKELATEYSELASVYLAQKKSALAIEYYKKSLAIKEKQGIAGENTGWTLERISTAYKEMGNLKESFVYRIKFFELVKKINDPYGIMESLKQMAFLFRDAGDTETAADYNHQLINYIHANLDTFKTYPIAYSYIGSAQLRLNNNDSALYYFDKAIEITDLTFWSIIGKEYTKKSAQSLKANVYLNKNEYDKALECVAEPLEFFKKNKMPDKTMDALLIISKAYLGKKNYTIALDYSKEAFQIAKQTSSQEGQKEASKILWKTYHQINNSDSAYYYLQQYLLVKESMDENRSANELALFRATQEDKEKQTRIELLGNQNKIKEQDLLLEQQNFRRENLTKKFLIAGLLGLFVLGIIVFRSILLKRKLESEKRFLAEKELQLQKLQNERRITDMEMMALRSQMNPHFIFNCLNSINRFVLRNDTESASNYLTKFSKLMRMVLENSKQVLIPLGEEVKCLELYIQMEQFRCKNSFTYYVKYHDGVNTEEAMIPPLLLQPFVENAIWHGVNPKEGDGKIGIEFFQKEEALYCVIKDNGIGRKKASELKSQLSQHHKSMGLQITKERLAILEEEHTNESPVEIEDLFDENEQAAGTKVTIRIFSLPEFEELKSSLNL